MNTQQRLETIAGNIVTLVERPKTHHYGTFFDNGDIRVYGLRSKGAKLFYFIQPEVVELYIYESYFHEHYQKYIFDLKNINFKNIKEIEEIISLIRKYFPEVTLTPMINSKFKTIMDRMTALCNDPPKDLPYSTRLLSDGDLECYYDDEKAGIFLNYDWNGIPSIYYSKEISGALGQFFTNEWDDPENYEIFIAMLEEDFPEIFHDLLTLEERMRAMEYLRREYPEFYEKDL